MLEFSIISKISINSIANFIHRPSACLGVNVHQGYHNNALILFLGLRWQYETCLEGSSWRYPLLGDIFIPWGRRANRENFYVWYPSQGFSPELNLWHQGCRNECEHCWYAHVTQRQDFNTVYLLYFITVYEECGDISL